MKRSSLSRFFLYLMKIKRLRRLAFKKVCQIEGGIVYSTTARTYLYEFERITIGAYSYGDCLFPGRLPSGTKIGNYCSIANGLRIFRRNHPIDRVSQHALFYNAILGQVKTDTISSNEDNPISIGHDVWIGQNTIITPSCKRIGNGAIVASGALVSKDIPDFSVVGGFPAKHMKRRFDESMRFAINKMNWWLKPIDTLMKRSHYFTNPADEVDIDEMMDLLNNNMNTQLTNHV